MNITSIDKNPMIKAVNLSLNLNIQGVTNKLTISENELPQKQAKLKQMALGLLSAHTQTNITKSYDNLISSDFQDPSNFKALQRVKKAINYEKFGNAYFKSPNSFAFSNNEISHILNLSYKFSIQKDTLTPSTHSSTLSTAYGDVKVFLDLYDDNDKLGIGDLASNVLLFNFDSNGDGVLNGSDELYSKLKVRGYDKDGNERIMRLADATDGMGIDLAKFIDNDAVNKSLKEIDKMYKQPDKNAIDETVDKRIFYYSSNPYTNFSTENRYEKLSNESIDKFFDTYADKDGWVSINNQTMSGFNNLAYEKMGFDGKLRLSEFNYISDVNYSKDHDSYSAYQKDSFMKFYNDYQIEEDFHIQNVATLSRNLKEYGVEGADELISKLSVSKSSFMIAMQNEFEKATGLKFSTQNLEKVKRAFEADANKAAASLSDSDSVIAMKRNTNGTYTLRFDSGRELIVTELYSDTGKLLEYENGVRASVILDAKNMDEIELNTLDFSTVGIKQGEKFQTLKELGVNFIKSVLNKYSNQFLLTLSDNKTISSKELYNLSFAKDLEKHIPKIDEKDKLYQKVDKRA
ncbi:hypothetical protein LMG7974_01161 [Campylobacter majalis]|uniref:Response regulator n=1 Tax=Campylobacter majalis TaxID=2790656 RepID=A0ABN7KBN9_9BACT|nr:response regulator [Campylobacter majalis]CAD7288803.1 hypothetical protein LMG7974_01161 [Campylobacter majalis]